MLQFLNFWIILAKSLEFWQILTEFWSEKFEWFGPSPIEPFNLGGRRRQQRHDPRAARGPEESRQGGPAAAEAPGEQNPS